MVVEMAVAADGGSLAGEVYRAPGCTTGPSWPTTAVAAWLEGERPAAAGLAAVPGLAANLRLQDRAAQAMKTLRHAPRRARPARPSRRGRCSTATALAGLELDEKNRASS